MDKVAHLSDLHLTDDASWTNLEAMEVVLKKIRPALLVVSGDFMDHPEDGVITKMSRRFTRPTSTANRFTLEKIRDYLNKLRVACGENCQLVVVPGNHDYRNFGNFRLKPGSRAFDEAFPHWRQASAVDLAGGRKLVVFPFDSNTNDPRVNAARGCVGKDEYKRFQQEVARMKELLPGSYDSALKLAILHHHPLPIADSENNEATSHDGFLGLDDAGSFLREMAGNGIDIILHGHKHHPFSTRLEINLNARVHYLTIIAAGSATKATEPERSFNVITLDHRQVYGETWKQKTGFATWDVLPVFPIVTYDQHLRRRQHEFEAHADTRFRYRKVDLVYSINKAGDSRLSIRYSDLEPTQGPLASLEVERECRHGDFGGYSWTPEGDQASAIVPRVERKPGLLKGTVEFSPQLQKGRSLTFEHRCLLFNAFALTQEQRERLIDPSNRDQTTEMVKIFTGNPIRDLIASVHFEDVEFPAGMRVIAYNSKLDCEDAHETARCGQHLRLCRVSRTATLTLPSPVGGLTYRLIWNLPLAPPSRSPKLDIGKRQAIGKALEQITSRENSQNPLFEIFRNEAHRLSQRFASTPLHSLEVGILAFDSRLHKLRFVAGHLREKTWDYHLYDGQGVAGRASKLGSFLVVLPHQVAPEENFVSPALAGMDTPHLVACIPLRFPLATKEGEGDPVAVLSIATYHEASGLLSLYDDTAACERLILEAQLLFGSKILPALGLGDLLTSNHKDPR